MANDFRQLNPTGRYYLGPHVGPYHRPPARSDEAIEKELRTSLAEDSWVDENRMDLSVESGVVTLRGTVDSVTAKRSAGDDAWDVAGVLDVNNELEVSPPRK